MQLDKEIVPAIVSIHLGLVAGKAQILVEADLAAFALKEGESASPAVKAVLSVVAQMIKLVP
jgi:hypothetical protein